MIRSSGFKVFRVKGMPGNRWPSYATFYDSVVRNGQFEDIFIDRYMSMSSRSTYFGRTPEVYRRNRDLGRGQNPRQFFRF